MSRTVFRDAHVPGFGSCDISVEERKIVSISHRETSVGGRPPASSTRLVDHEVDLGGRLVLPSLVEPHAHLDKAYLSDTTDNASGDLLGAIRALEAHRGSITVEDIADRAERAARRMASFGVSRIRTHVDTTLAGGLEPLSGVAEARRRCADVVDIEIAALVDWPLTGREGTSRMSLARDALAAGADVIGGCPHLDDDPVGAVHRLVDLALEYSVPLDLHADENLRPGSDDLGTLARRILDDGLKLTANASHCVSLSVKDHAVQRKIADDVAAAGVTVTVLPQTNLFLQARGADSAAPRGIAPVGLLRSAGVVVGAGGDNLQDPFNPLGTGDPLETAALCVWAAHVPVDAAFDLVSIDASACTGASVALEVGAPADFVAFRATSVRSAIAERPADRLVIRRGVVI